MNEHLPPEAAPPPPAADAATKVRTSWRIRLVTAACLFALFGLGITIVHLVWPSPLLFALFMTIGQGAFGVAIILYLIVIFIDLRRRKVL
jgi:hypothetical protein